MSEERIYLYEGMFLFPQSALSNLEAATEHINKILARAEAEIIAFSKWDERRLAYEIKGNKRGVYFLVYFKAKANLMTQVERACNLSEELLRSMFLRADHVPAELIEAAEGKDQLADEIKLRSEQAETAGSAASQTSSVSTREDREKAAKDKAEAEAAAAAETASATATATAEEEAPAAPAAEEAPAEEG